MKTEQRPRASGGADEMTQVASSTSATLPLVVSAKWVAYACRMAAVGKPRWERATSRWTATGADQETIVIRQGTPPNVVLVEVIGASDTADTARRLITAFFTGMQWAVRRRAVA